MTEDPSVTLIRTIVDAMSDSPLRAAPEQWTSFSLVLGLRDSGEASTTYGYAYGPDETHAFSVKPRMVNPAVLPYLASQFGPGAKLPVKLLVQFDRASGRYEVTFEDTDASRWQVSPATIDTIREELRPRLGE